MFPKYYKMFLFHEIIEMIVVNGCFGLPWCSDGKNPPAMQATQIQSLGSKDPLKKGMATHSSILAWRIPWTEEPGGFQCMGS